VSGGPQSGIPATARAIMNIVPERKVPSLTDKQQQQAEGVARAVRNLSQVEHRVGAARWEP
jgi:hypothetical protein